MGNRTELEKEISFAKVLGEVMEDPNYLLGSEPESLINPYVNWDITDFSGWEEQPFTEVNTGGWILAKKDFVIVDNEGGYFPFRITEFDPDQTKIRKHGMRALYAIRPLIIDTIPTIIVGKDDDGNEVMLSEINGGIHLLDLINLYFEHIKGNVPSSDEPELKWANFIKLVLESKQILPDQQELFDEAVR